VFRRSFAATIAIAGVLYSGVALAQSASLSVSGEVAHPLTLSAAELAALPHQQLKVEDEKGNPETYSGVPISAILEKAGAPLGKELRGKNMTLYVLAGATDNYHAVFALAELDPAFTDRVVVVADQRDGKPLPPKEGPIRLVAPGEKRHARWVRNLTSLTVKRAE